MQDMELSNRLERLIEPFQAVRQQSLTLCQSLEVEDFNLQAMASTSPVKWHLAHTSWFFETFILKRYDINYRVFDPQYEYLFNSYYNGIGKQFPRPQRGLLSRPSLETVYAYRQHIDQAIVELLANSPLNETMADEIQSRIELGLNHEQQHQELILTDLKYCFAQNPLHPIYRAQALPQSANISDEIEFIKFDAELIEIGADEQGFCFDNELPRHKVQINDFGFANRLVNNGEYLAFIEAGGYQTADYWLADAWALIQQEQWQKPLYWQQYDGIWFEYTLHGIVELDMLSPVSFISAYEADAFARWCDARLASEAEWEHVYKQCAPQAGQFVEAGFFHPLTQSNQNTSNNSPQIEQLAGVAWQWTQSAYSSYPGFKAAKGAIGEYNGKFMCNQLVLKGGSCFTPKSHFRPSYRNFFYPQDRWQNTGIRLVKDRF